MRTKLKVGALVGCTVILILFSGAVRASVFHTLILCAEILIPSLFPFFVISGMLSDIGLSSLFGGTTAALMTGFLCGYPLGARSVCTYYRDGILTKKQAERLLMCTSNASPAFLVIAVGGGILKDMQWGVKLLILQSIGSLILFFLFVPKNKASAVFGVSISMIDSLMKNLKTAAEQMLIVCGTTAFFGIFYDFSQKLPINSPVKEIIGGMIELTHGCTAFSSDGLLPLGMIIGLSGICVWTQCCYYIRQSDLSAIYLMIGKLWQGIWIPVGIFLLQNTQITVILLIGLIIILTNAVLMCIIRKRGCERFDFFKRD